MAGTLNAGALSIAIMADTAKLSQGFNDAQRKTASFAQTIERDIGSRLKRVFNPVTLGIVGTTAAVGGLVAAIKLAADSEVLDIQFRTLLKSGEAAKSLIKEIRQFAAETPFESTELAAASKQLLAYGIESEKVMDVVRQLGDISALSGASIGDLAYLYGTAAAQGRLFTVDVRQFGNRGIPMLQELAKQFGVGTEEMGKLIEQGKVGFPELEKAIQSLTTGTGLYAGGMRALSETAAGMWSTFKDEVKESLRLIGEQFIPALRDLLPIITDLAKQFAKIGSVVEILSVNRSTGTAAEKDLDEVRRNLFVLRGNQYGAMTDSARERWKAEADAMAEHMKILQNVVAWEKHLAREKERAAGVAAAEEMKLRTDSIGGRGASTVGDAVASAITGAGTITAMLGGKFSMSGILGAIGSAIAPAIKPALAGFTPAAIGIGGGPGRAEFRGNDAVLAGSVEAARLAAIQRMRLPHETEAVKIQRQQLATLKSIDKKAGAVPANVLVAF